MLVKKSDTIINLEQFNCIQASNKYVDAVCGLCTIRIAECETENYALALVHAISVAWAASTPIFDVNNWCKQHNATVK